MPEKVLNNAPALKLDIRFANTRQFRPNCWNRDKKPRKTNTSGYPGVMWRKDSEKWRAYITVDKKRINLGTYDRIEEALEARKTAEEKYWK